MKFKFVQTFFAVQAGCAMLVVSATLLGISYSSSERSNAFVGESTNTQASERAKAELTSLAQAKATEIGAKLESALQTAEQLAVVNASIGKSGSDGKPLVDLPREQLSNLARETLLAKPDLLSVYITWEPNAFGSSDSRYSGIQTDGYDGTGRFVPSWYRGPGGEILQMPSPSIESQKRLPTGVREGEYYLCARETRKACAINPAPYDLEGGGRTLLASFTAPILINGKFQGIVGVD